MKIALNASPGASGVIAIADSLAGNDARTLRHPKPTPDTRQRLLLGKFGWRNRDALPRGIKTALNARRVAGLQDLSAPSADNPKNELRPPQSLTNFMEQNTITKTQANAIVRRFFNRIEADIKVLFDGAPGKLVGLDETATKATASALAAELRRATATALSESVKSLEGTK